MTGKLVDTEGNPVEGHIYAVAWPTFEVLGRLGIGDQVLTEPVAWAATDSDGSFTLRVDPAISLAEFTEPEGFLTFDVQAMGAGMGGMYGFSREMNSTGTMWIEPGIEAAPDPILVRMESRPAQP